MVRAIERYRGGAPSTNRSRTLRVRSSELRCSEVIRSSRPSAWCNGRSAKSGTRWIRLLPSGGGRSGHVSHRTSEILPRAETDSISVYIDYFVRAAGLVHKITTTKSRCNLPGRCPEPGGFLCARVVHRHRSRVYNPFAYPRPLRRLNLSPRLCRLHRRSARRYSANS